MISNFTLYIVFNANQHGLFQGCSRMGCSRVGAKMSPSLKSATHTLQRWNLAQLYLTERILKDYMSHVTHSLSSADIIIFLLEISKFCCIKKYRFRFHLDAQLLIFLTLLEYLTIVLINMVAILMMSVKIAIPGLLQLKIFWKKVYDVINFVYGVT